MKTDPVIALLATHEFEYHTGFCRNCGQPKTHIIDRQIACFGGADTKILAMSHLRAAVIADERENKVTYGSGNMFHDLGIPDPRDPGAA